MARGFKIADAYAEIHVDTDELRRGASKIPGQLGPEMDRAGKGMGQRLGKSLGDESTRQGNDAGGKLAMGMRMSVIRNSPLIVAAVGAALAVGAPVLMAGAVGLFAGIGIVAAAQSEKVGHAWSTLFSEMGATTVKAASVIEPVLVKVADNVGDAFQRMMPQIRRAFAAAAPQIEVFARGLTDLAENAMPGLVRAVERGMPVTEGLADFLAKVGTGLSDFFDRISSHGPAAGQVFSSLGDIMATLLPILGELLGQGAELAADILPLLSSSLGLVLKVVDALGPVLPIIAAGFGALKIANMVSGGIGTLAAKLGEVAANGGAFSGIAGKLSGGLGGITAAAGPAAAGVAFFVTASLAWIEAGRRSEEQAISLGRALEVGGRQADAAAAYVEKFAFANDFLDTGLGSAIGSMGVFGYTISDMVPDLEQGGEAYRTWYEALDPGKKATEDVAVATETLRQKVLDYGPASKEAAEASKDLAQKQADLEQKQADLEMATKGVTDAMLAQADAALALADSDLAHRQAIDQAEDSYAALNKAIRDHGAASEEASDAAMDWEGDLNRIVATAGKLASDTLPANMDANSKLALSQIAQRDALRELAAEYGDKLPPALQSALASLEATTAGYDLAALEADRVAAATGTATEKMQKLGSTEAVPKIKAESSVFEGVHARTGEKLKQLDATVATPKAKLNSSVFAGVHADAMSKIAQLAAQQPTPSAWLNSGPFGGTLGWVLSQIGYLSGQRPTPAVLLADYASGGLDKIANKLAALHDKTVTVTTKELKGKAGGGPIFAATGRKVFGPGGPTDDLVPAGGPGDVDYQLSAGEWIVNAMASRQQGDGRMALLNAGMATIVPNTGRGLADGGTPNPITGTGQTSRSVTVQNLNVTFSGADFSGDRRSMRRAALLLREELLNIERSER